MHQGLVNMDIKPCNIMVPADGHMGVGIDVGSVVPLSMIRRGVFYWTKGFAGPEVHSSKVPNSVAAEKVSRAACCRQGIRYEVAMMGAVAVGEAEGSLLQADAQHDAARD
jgi:serine/threonine protein kinase